MLRNRQRWIMPLIAAAAAAVSTGSLHAAELRTTACNRTICRQVSFQDVVVEDGMGAVLEPQPIIDSPCAACGDGECLADCLQPCGRWVSLEYLLWWRRGRGLPPLVTTSPDNTPQNSGAPNFDPIAGVVGLDTTTILLGGGTVGQDARPGGRVSVGTWLDGWQCNGVEGRFWSLGQETVSFEAQSLGSPILARPFFDNDPAFNRQDARLLAFPGLTTDGRVTVTSESEVLGGDFLYRRLLCIDRGFRLDLLAGYQFARIDENLVVSDSLADDNPENLIPDGTINAKFDSIYGRNEFHAGQIGIAADYYGPCWRLACLAKVGFGNMRQTIDAAGRETTDGVLVDPSISHGGLLVSQNGTNPVQRSLSQEKFAVSPELNVTAYWQLNECLELSVGYTFIYWSSVVQPGAQIPLTESNGFGLPTVPPPGSPSINDSSYWLHGLNFGAELRF